LGVAAIDGDLQQSRAPEESQGLTGMDIMVSFLEPIDAPAFSFDLPRPIFDLGSVFSTGYIRNQITEGISEENLAHHLPPFNLGARPLDPYKLLHPRSQSPGVHSE
jgi:hypothetical protein